MEPRAPRTSGSQCHEEEFKYCRNEGQGTEEGVMSKGEAINKIQDKNKE